MTSLLSVILDWAAYRIMKRERRDQLTFEAMCDLTRTFILREERARMDERMSCGHRRRHLQFPENLTDRGENDPNFCVPCEAYAVGSKRSTDVARIQEVQDRARLASLEQGFRRDGSKPLDEF